MVVWRCARARPVGLNTAAPSVAALEDVEPELLAGHADVHLHLLHPCLLVRANVLDLADRDAAGRHLAHLLLVLRGLVSSEQMYRFSSYL